MAGRQGGLTLHSGELSRMYYSLDSGANFYELPGVMSYAESGGAAPVRQPKTFTGVGQRRGLVSPQAVAVQAYYAPIHAGWEAMLELVLSGETVEFKMETPQIVLIELATPDDDVGPSVSIAVNGLVSVIKGSDAGAFDVPNLDDRYASGQVLNLATPAATFLLSNGERMEFPGAGVTNYKIDTIDLSKSDLHEALTVRPAPAAAVVAGSEGNQFAVQVPALRRQFRAFVTNCDVSSLQSEGDLSAPLELASTGRLPAWQAVNL